MWAYCAVIGAHRQHLTRRRCIRWRSNTAAERNDSRFHSWKQMSQSRTERVKRAGTAQLATSQWPRRQIHVTQGLCSNVIGCWWLDWNCPACAESAAWTMPCVSARLSNVVLQKSDGSGVRMYTQPLKSAALQSWFSCREYSWIICKCFFEFQ